MACNFHHIYFVYSGCSFIFFQQFIASPLRRGRDSCLDIKEKIYSARISDMHAN